MFTQLALMHLTVMKYLIIAAGQYTVLREIKSISNDQ
jgi:hypothetical protein